MVGVAGHGTSKAGDVLQVVREFANKRHPWNRQQFADLLETYRIFPFRHFFGDRPEGPPPQRP